MAGANDRVRVAVCGIRGQGFEHIKEYSRMPNVEVAAVCDIDENVVRERLADMECLAIPKPVVYNDPRRVMEDKSIDAVSIATPNHWHALLAIWGCQAGKDIYVEKPCSHNWWEGRQMVRAAEKYNRIVQHGTQLRAAPHYQEAWKLVRDGVIGKPMMVKAINNQKRRRHESFADGTVPAGVNYDIWMGPAPARPFAPRSSTPASTSTTCS